MADRTFIHARFAGLTQATSPSTSTRAAVPVWAGGRVRMEVNPKSLAERWKG